MKVIIVICILALCMDVMGDPFGERGDRFGVRGDPFGASSHTSGASSNTSGASSNTSGASSHTSGASSNTSGQKTFVPLTFTRVTRDAQDDFCKRHQCVTVTAAPRPCKPCYLRNAYTKRCTFSKDLCGRQDCRCKRQRKVKKVKYFHRQGWKSVGDRPKGKKLINIYPCLKKSLSVVIFHKKTGFYPNSPRPFLGFYVL